MGKEGKADVVITEIGGTIGDIESQPFIEAIRQIGYEAGRENCLYVHVTLVPYLKASGEHKSKPTQHSVKELQGMGISPDIIVLRCDEKIEDENIFTKIADFCNVKPDCVIENLTLPVLYEAPIYLEKSGLYEIVCRELGLTAWARDLSDWAEMVERVKHPEKTVKIGLVGKYVQLHDAYLSVAEALRHAGYALRTKVDIDWIDSEGITDSNAELVLGGLDGIIVPGGFGGRGIEGMISACRYAREHNVPYLGLCLGMQISVIEFARHVCGLSDANSGEFDPGSKHKVIDFLPDQSDETDKGGTLRLGSWPCHIKKGTVMDQCYRQAPSKGTEELADGSLKIAERHRHRYEFNNEYRKQLSEAGLVLSGTAPDDSLVETVELDDKAFFVGVQYHPEFKSRPNRPHPLFLGFIKASLMKG